MQASIASAAVAALALSSVPSASGKGYPPTPTPPTQGFNYDATHGEDSRMIAYVGNWQTCPTIEQTDAYSHMLIAFAVSYTWSPGKNNCDSACNVAPTVPICNDQNNQALIDSWRAAGKKVILAFGGAGMGGSWSGDQNNCWDYCFGMEQHLSTQLVNIIAAQQLDGISINYEYCYDTAGKQRGKCKQRSDLYSDAKAQTFLNTITHAMRVKLDYLQERNGYDGGRYQVTHAPMDTDLAPSSSAYFQILHNRRADLDFLMPQFYNGVTRPAVDGVDGVGAGSLSAAAMFGSLSNELFDSEPNKVVFGHCISACSGMASNTNAAQAAVITADLKNVQSTEFACNGGVFFWAALYDVGGEWSNAVVAEVSKTAGCHAKNPRTPPVPTTPRPVTRSPVTRSPVTPTPVDPKPSEPPLTPSPVTPNPIAPGPTPTDGGCSDNPLPGVWGAGGHYTCDFYEVHGGVGYCGHTAIANNCCFCGGGSS